MTGSRVVRLLTLGMVAAFVTAVTTEAMGTSTAFGTPEQKARAQGKGNGNGGGGGGGGNGGGGKNTVDVTMDVNFDIRSGHVLSGDINDGSALDPQMVFEAGKKETIIFDFSGSDAACINWLVTRGVLTGGSNMFEKGGKVSLRTQQGDWLTMTASPVDVRAKFTIFGKKQDPAVVMRFYPAFGNAPNDSDYLRAWRDGDGTWTIVSGVDAGGNTIDAKMFVYINLEAASNNTLCDVSLRWTATQ